MTGAEALVPDRAALIGALAAAALAAALVAGVFLTFSDFVMRSLAASEGGAGAMQQINRKVYRSVFMGLFLGLVPVSALALWLGAARGLPWPAAGGGVYLAGVFVVTGLGNVPMNRRLDWMAPGGAQARAYWPRYVRRWTALNHLRSIAALVAALFFLIGAVRLAGGA